jgi:hypothetical protein
MQRQEKIGQDHAGDHQRDVEQGSDDEQPAGGVELSGSRSAKSLHFLDKLP